MNEITTEKANIFKNKVILALRNIIQDEDEVSLLDVFKYDRGKSLQLTHYGYRNLKDHYDFHELEFQFQYNIENFSTLSVANRGMFYYTLDKKNGIMTLFTTDTQFMSLIKLSSNRFDLYVRKYHRKNNEDI